MCSYRFDCEHQEENKAAEESNGHTVKYYSTNRRIVIKIIGDLERQQEYNEKEFEKLDPFGQSIIFLMGFQVFGQSPILFSMFARFAGVEIPTPSSTPHLLQEKIMEIDKRGPTMAATDGRFLILFSGLKNFVLGIRTRPIVKVETIQAGVAYKF